MTKPSALIVGGVSFNQIVHVPAFPGDQPGNVYSSERYTQPASTSMGKALNLAALGFRVTLIAQIGEDDGGRAIARALEGAGVRFLPIIDDRGTEQHLNLMRPDGARQSIFLSYRTFDPVVPLDLIATEVADHDVCVIDIINMARAALRPALEAGKPIWTDLHDYDGGDEYHADFLSAANAVFCSHEKLDDPAGYLRWLGREGKSPAMITQGREGAIGLDEDQALFHQPIWPGIEVTDTNGAGDAFFSGALFGHIAGEPLRTCAAFGAIAAGLCVQSRTLAHPALTPEHVRALHAAATTTPS